MISKRSQQESVVESTYKELKEKHRESIIMGYTLFEALGAMHRVRYPG